VAVVPVRLAGSAQVEPARSPRWPRSREQVLRLDAELADGRVGRL
jgi:hypothetical protein